MSGDIFGCQNKGVGRDWSLLAREAGKLEAGAVIIKASCGGCQKQLNHNRRTCVPDNYQATIQPLKSWYLVNRWVKCGKGVRFYFLGLQNQRGL